MAWLIGDLSPEERRRLLDRGWLLEDPVGYFGEEAGFSEWAAAVFVDRGLFELLDEGPDNVKEGKMRHPKLEKVSCRYGAPMGRSGVLPKDATREFKLHIAPMRMSGDGDYDEGGAYWGCGSPSSGFMWVAWGKLNDEPVTVFVRAIGRAKAETAVREHLPNVLFYE